MRSEADAFLAEHELLRDIVRRVAGVKHPVSLESGQCHFCGMAFCLAFDKTLAELDAEIKAHEVNPRCAWKQAREWVAEGEWVAPK